MKRRYSTATGSSRSREHLASLLLAAPILGLLVVPLLALIFASSPAELRAAVGDPLFLPALLLSARTTVLSLVLVAVGGTPLAWWLATARTNGSRLVEAMVYLPIVMPPAVVGVALLQTFGLGGLLGSELRALGIQIPFTSVAVVLAQVVVSAPFFVQGAAAAFREIDSDLLIVARTLGHTPAGVFFRVAAPLASPGLVGAAALAWARGLGEFGATLLFAGNMTGRTQTMPLAIYTALEGDVRVAVALSLGLAAASALLLLGVRAAPSGWIALRRGIITAIPRRLGRT